MDRSVITIHRAIYIATMLFKPFKSATRCCTANWNGKALSRLLWACATAIQYLLTTEMVKSTTTCRPLFLPFHFHLPLVASKEQNVPDSPEARSRNARRTNEEISQMSPEATTASRYVPPQPTDRFVYLLVFIKISYPVIPHAYT